MTREDYYLGHYDGVLVNPIVRKIFDDFESRSCTSCKWCKQGGEFENDECHNTSLSGHLDTGTLVADDFCCNRWEPKDG